MRPNTLRERSMQTTILVSVSLISTTSAASAATSVPVPMATPRSAWARAGESLIPSPTMATMAGLRLPVFPFFPFFLWCPALCSFLTMSALCFGSTSDITHF